MGMRVIRGEERRRGMGEDWGRWGLERMADETEEGFETSLIAEPGMSCLFDRKACACVKVTWC